MFSDGFSGSTLDRKKWVTCWWWAPSEEEGCTNGGNPQQSWVLPRNVSVSKGVLQLKVVREQHVAEGRTYEWTSGMVTTGRIGQATADNPVKFGFKYGYLEARMRFPDAAGHYSAFWAGAVDNGWPPEIDVIERAGDRPEAGHTNYHYLDAEGKHQGPWQDYVYPALGDRKWHRIGVDWQPGLLIWYVDGREVSRSERPEGVADEPMHLLLAGEIWGRSGWTDGPDATTPKVSVTEVDYVKVWQRTGDPSAPPPALPRVEPVAVEGTAGTTPANGPAAAFDGNPATSFRSAVPVGCYATADAGRRTAIDSVRFVPGTSPDRTRGGRLQGAVGQEGPWTTLATLNRDVWTSSTHLLEGRRTYRYFRYVGPSGSDCSMAEIELRRRR